jgi:hypothetical protein
MTEVALSQIDKFEPTETNLETEPIDPKTYNYQQREVL